MRYKERSIIRDLVYQRVKELFNLAILSIRNNNIEFARKYCKLIKKLSMRSRVRLPRKVKRMICKQCFIPLVPGLTCRVRIRSEGKNSRIVITCLLCGWVHRYRIKR